MKCDLGEKSVEHANQVRHRVHNPNYPNLAGHLLVLLLRSSIGDGEKLLAAIDLPDVSQSEQQWNTYKKTIYSTTAVATAASVKLHALPITS